MGCDYLDGTGMQKRASFGASPRGGGTGRGSNDRQLSGCVKPFARPHHCAVIGGPTSGLVPCRSGGPASAGGLHLLRVPSRVQNLLPNAIGGGTLQSHSRIGEGRHGRDDRYFRERTDGSVGQGTRRQCDATVDTDKAPKYDQVTLDLNQVRAGRRLVQDEGHGGGFNGVRRRLQGRFDCAHQRDASVDGVVLSRLRRRLALTGIKSDAERLARQLEDVHTLDHVGPKRPRSLISDRGGACCNQVFRGGETRYYRCRYRDRPHLYNHLKSFLLFVSQKG